MKYIPEILFVKEKNKKNGKKKYEGRQGNSCNLHHLQENYFFLT